MSAKTLVILGATGNTGRAIARLLVARTKVHLVLAGRSRARLEFRVAALDSEFPGGRVRMAVADATDPPSLHAASPETLLRTIQGLDPKGG